MSFYEMAYNVDYENGQTVGNWEMGDFDLIKFWKGEKYDGEIPESVRLYIRSEDENLEHPDILPNPVSWLIVSQRLLDFWLPSIKSDIQIFGAPVYRQSDGVKVEGYKLINPICVLSCVDLEKTKTRIDKRGKLTCIGDIYIKKDCVKGHHMFRAKENMHAVIVSYELAHSLEGKGFKGLAFIRCEAT